MYVCTYVCVCVYIYQTQRTPLHLAAGYGHGKIVETLVQAKADLCARDYMSVMKETRLDAHRGMRKRRGWHGDVWCNSVWCAGTHDTLAR